MVLAYWLQARGENKELTNSNEIPCPRRILPQLTNDCYTLNALAAEACRSDIGECLPGRLWDEQVILGPTRGHDVRVAQVVVSFIGRCRLCRSQGECSCGDPGSTR